jgi:hypothetical protein
MSINAFRAVTLSASILLLAACSSSTKKADSHSGDEENRGQAIAAKLNEGQKVGTPINTICPIGGHGADTMIPVAYKGKTIGFCCGGCVEEFESMTIAQRDEVLGRAEKNVGL